MFTEPRVMVRDHLEIALLILSECRMASDPAAVHVRAAIDALDAATAGSPRSPGVVVDIQSNRRKTAPDQGSLK